MWLSCDPLDCSLLGSSVHGIFQARKLEWVTIFFLQGSSQPRDQIHVSCIGMQILYSWATRGAKKMVGCIWMDLSRNWLCIGWFSFHLPLFLKQSVVMTKYNSSILNRAYYIIPEQNVKKRQFWHTPMENDKLQLGCQSQIGNRRLGWRNDK